MPANLPSKIYKFTLSLAKSSTDYLRSLRTNSCEDRIKKEESPYKPDPVLRLREWGTIHLVAGLLARSSDLPDDSSEQLSAPSFWSCSKWGLPSH